MLTKARVAVPVSAISSIDVLLKGMRSIVEYHSANVWSSQDPGNLRPRCT